MITDLGMPYVDGRKVAAAVKAPSPRHPVILLTGWGQRLIADERHPAARRPGAEQAAAAARAARGARRSWPHDAASLARLLIVDDEAAQMRALCDTLERRAIAHGLRLRRARRSRLRPATSICC